MSREYCYFTILYTTTHWFELQTNRKTLQNKTINLTNFFPISSDSLDIDQNNHDSVEITITGDTTYSRGIEYLITAIDVHNTFNDKVIPVSITVAADDGLGNSDGDYFNNRGGEISEYKILYGETLKEDMPLLELMHIVFYSFETPSSIHSKRSKAS